MYVRGKQVKQLKAKADKYLVKTEFLGRATPFEKREAVLGTFCIL